MKFNEMRDLGVLGIGCNLQPMPKVAVGIGCNLQPMPKCQLLTIFSICHQTDPHCHADLRIV